MEYTDPSSEQNRGGAQDYNVRGQALWALQILSSINVPSLEAPMTAKDWEGIYWLDACPYEIFHDA